MSQKTSKASDSANAVGRGVLFAGFCAFWMPFGWVLLAIIGWGAGFDLSMSKFVPTLIVVAVVAFLAGLGSSAQENHNRDETQRKHDATVRAQESSDLRSRLEALRRDADQGAAAAAAEFCSLAPLARTACDYGAEAQGHYKNKAYSPFWAAIENAFVALGDSNRVLTGIQSRASRHASTVADYRRLGGTAPLPPFPDLAGPVAEAGKSASVIANSLRDMAYEAQREAVYAQIWEQRRTTAAVVAGFSSMEQAVSRLGATIELSAQTVRDAIRSSGVTVGAAVHSAAAGSTAKQLEAQDRVAKRLGDAVWLLDDQRKRALGWR